MPLKTKHKQISKTTTTKKRTTSTKPYSAQKHLEKNILDSTTDNETAMEIAKKELFNDVYYDDYLDELNSLLSASRMLGYSPLTLSEFKKKVLKYEEHETEQIWSGKEFLDWVKKWNKSIGDRTNFVPMYNKNQIKNSNSPSTIPKGKLVVFYPSKCVKDIVAFAKINPITKVRFSPAYPIIIEHKKGVSFIAPVCHYDYNEDTEEYEELPFDSEKYAGARKLITMVRNNTLQKDFENQPSFIKTLDLASKEKKLPFIDSAIDFDDKKLKEWKKTPLRYDIKGVDGRNVTKLKQELRKLDAETFLSLYRIFVPEGEHVVRNGTIELDENGKPYYKIKSNKIDVSLSVALTTELFRKLYELDEKKFEKHLFLVEQQMKELKGDVSGEAKDTMKVFKKVLKEAYKWKKSSKKGTSGAKKFFVISENGQTSSANLGIVDLDTMEEAEEVKKYMEELSSNKFLIIEADNYTDAYNKVLAKAGKEDLLGIDIDTANGKVLRHKLHEVNRQLNQCLDLRKKLSPSLQAYKKNEQQIHTLQTAKAEIEKRLERKNPL